MLGAFSQRWSRVASEHNDRYVSRSRLALEVLNQLPSVTVAQREVRDDHVWMRFPSPPVGLVAISGPDCFETEEDKAPGRTGHACRRDRRRRVPAVGTAGSGDDGDP